MIRGLFLLSACVAVAFGQFHYESKADCDSVCTGSRLTNPDQQNSCLSFVRNQQTGYHCSCQSGYFVREDQCDAECTNVYWSLFTYGTCTDAAENEGCRYTCGSRIRLWTTVFIFVTFVAAVVICIFILPMCITSCTACIVAKKERKSRKKAQQGGEAYAASYDGRGDVVAAKGGPPSTLPAYNPYMYWPSYYQGR